MQDKNLGGWEETKDHLLLPPRKTHLYLTPESTVTHISLDTEDPKNNRKVPVDSSYNETSVLETVSCLVEQILTTY